MKRIKDIILSDKTPMNKNSLWLKDGNLKYFEGIWKNIDTSKMSTNTSDIILDIIKAFDDIEYLKNFIKQGETWAKNNGTYNLDEDVTATFIFPVLCMYGNMILIPSFAYSLDNKIIVFPKSKYLSIVTSDENSNLTTEETIITGNIKIDLNNQDHYFDFALATQLESEQGLLEFTLNGITQLPEETLTKIKNRLMYNGSFSCIVDGSIALCRQENNPDRIIITISKKYGDPNADDSPGNIEVYKNYDSIVNFLIDYNTGKILRNNQQINGPFITNKDGVGMVKQTSNIPALPSNAALTTVINAYNTLLTKLQDTGIMAKK